MPTPSSSRWFAWSDLPDDLQVLLSDYLQTGSDWTPPSGLWARPLNLSRLPAAPLDDEHAPLSAADAEAQGVDRGVAYALAMDLDQTPPLVIGQGRWLDGRHRAHAARAEGRTELLTFDLTLLVPPGHLARFGGLGPVAPLFQLYPITAGRGHVNQLPEPPPGRRLERVWSMMNAAKLAEFGPEHNVSAFLEDRLHDYQVTPSGQLYFYSRLVPTDATVEVVLDYETNEERKVRLQVRPPATSTPVVTPSRARMRR